MGLSVWAVATALLYVLLVGRSAQAQGLYSDHPSRSTILASADGRPLHDSGNHTRRHPKIDVLGYVTPWHPRGYTLAEQYRGKFDTISPVWYTLRTDGDPSLQRYVLHGGPPTDADAHWYHRLRQSATDESTGRTLPAVKVMPRVMLEDWTADDYRVLLGHTLEGMGFTEAIAAEVLTRGYDGVVLETGAAYAMREPIRLLSERLHDEGKQLVLVLPPLRRDTGQVNELVLAAVRDLHPLADQIHVMTYDHLGPGGQLWTAPGDVPPASPLAKDGVRTFGPNAPLSWMERNIRGISGRGFDGEASFPSDAADDFASQHAFVDVQASAAGSQTLSKLLAGVACYGYTYAVGWLDIDGKPQVVLPPSSPTAAKDNSTDEQEKYRTKAEQKEEGRRDTVFPILTKAGDSITFEELREVLQKNKVLVRQDEASRENFVDYLKLREDGATQRRPDGTEAPIAWYRRAYFPSARTMRARLELVEELGAGGVALWDIGQGGSWLLHEL
ncbi:unnamed protein product [Parajaminaea phylloscopi]